MIFSDIGVTIYGDALPSDFNAQFDIFEGVQQQDDIYTLIRMIDTYNRQGYGSKVQCDTDISDIETGKNYKVSFEKDSEGYINKAIIEEQ